MRLLEYGLRSSLLAAIAACGLAVGFPDAAHAAESPAVENKEIGEALLEAKRLASKKQWDAALAAVRRAAAVPDKSAYAAYKIDEFEAYLLTQQRKYSQAAQVFDELAQSDSASASQRARHRKTAAQLYMQAKAYDRAAQAAQAALKSAPDDFELLEIQGQAQFLGQDYRSAATTMRELVAMTEKSGKKPEEEWLQMIVNSYHRLNDREQTAAAWESLLEHYPKPQYWENVLEFKTARTESEPLDQGYRRLMFEVGVLRDPVDYEELALDAIDAGAPHEAVRVLQAGLENGSLGGNDEARFRRMLEFARERAAESEQRLPELARNAQSAPAAGIALGELYLGRGEYDKAIAALERALQSKELESPERVRVKLGIAYLKNRQAERAERVFAAVDRKSEWRDLAELWMLRARES